MNSKISFIAKSLLAVILMFAIGCPDGVAQRKRARTASETLSSSSGSQEETVTASSGDQQASTSRRRRTHRATENVESAQNKDKTVSRQTAKQTSASASESKEGKKSKNQSGLQSINVAAPDLEKIRKETLDPRSKFYFPKLYQKYEDKKNFEAMTPEEYRYLYLGYMFQEDYDPYRVSPYSKVTDEFRDKEKRTKADVDTIRKYAEKALKDNPFDLRQMSFLVRVLKEEGKDQLAKIWEYRLENFLGAIKSTGTGDKVENAWYVIYPMHEYDMLTILGYEAVDVDYIEPGYDYLIVTPDGSKKISKPAKGFYFNVQVPQQQYELKHPEDDADDFPDDDVSPDDLPAES